MLGLFAQVVRQFIAGRRGDLFQGREIHLHLLDHVVHGADALVLIPGAVSAAATDVVVVVDPCVVN